jgi:gas vesicle protein
MAEKNGVSIKTLLWAFFVGSLLGALLAPKSGKNSRQWIIQQGSHLSAQSKRLVNRGSAQLRYRAGSFQGITHKLKDMVNPELQLLEPDDDTIEQKVRTALGETPLTWDLPHVNVNSENGIVTVRGPVKNLKEKNNVEKVAKRIIGVKDVINKTRLVA